MNIQHSSRTDQWWTPIDIISRATEVLGGIDLDPATDERANIRVAAKYFFTEETDGLAQDWNDSGSIFLNPPGGKRGNRSLCELFWQKLMDTDHFDHAIFLAFSVEAGKTTQRDGKGGCLRFPFCVPAKRIAFCNVFGQPQTAPSHSNVIVYVPGKKNRTETFINEFESLGLVRR
jgi:hypothetical protein